jgi:hypothetical protein
VRWLIFLTVFVLGFGLGAWRAGAAGKSLLRASCELPVLLLICTSGLAGYLLYAARAGDSFAALAAASVTVIGVMLAILSLAGGLFGAWYRRAGQQP